MFLMIEFHKVSKIGIGTYRMSFKNKEHINSLHYAIDNNINLIDTSSNYLFGDSEILVGNLFEHIDRHKLFIITKAGYIQWNDLSRFSGNLNDDMTIKINESFYYSISKHFLGFQIKASLKRLKTDYIDGFLLHNPEYYCHAPLLTWLRWQ